MSQKSYNNTPTLYLISTPIGNMEDITLRAINKLKEVEVVFAEDTRVTRLLLNKLEIKKRLVANHEHNEIQNKEKLIKFLSDGYDVGLVSDRGTPVISVPGYNLVVHAIENNFNVVAIPGATALIPALITSGIQPAPFLFYGFLSNKDSKRKKELEILKKEKATLVLYESPHRIKKTLEEMTKIMGNRRISISREISKKFEEIYRGYLNDITEQLVDIKGEFVIVLEGENEDENYDNLTIVEHVNLYLKEGFDSKEAIKLVAKERNVPKSEIYSNYHNTK